MADALNNESAHADNRPVSPAPNQELFMLLLQLERAGKMSEATAEVAFANYVKKVLPPDNCQDPETWKRAAMLMSVDVLLSAKHAAHVVSVLSSNEKAFWDYLSSQAPHPTIGEFMGKVTNTLVEESALGALSASGKNAREGREKKKEPLLEFARDEARKYCAGRSQRPSRMQCVRAILKAVMDKAEKTNHRFLSDETATRRTVDGWLAKMPDASTLFKPR